jgi:hypothetical protein
VAQCINPNHILEHKVSKRGIATPVSNTILLLIARSRTLRKLQIKQSVPQHLVIGNSNPGPLRHTVSAWHQWSPPNSEPYISGGANCRLVRLKC